MSDLTQSADQVFISTLLANLQAGGVDSSRNLAPSTSAWQGRGHQLLDPRAQGSFEARPSSFQPHQSMNHVAPYSGSELAGLQTAGGSGRQAPPPADQGGRLSQLLQLLRQRQNGMQPTQPRPYSEAFEMSTMSAPGTSGPPPSNTHPSLSALTHAEHEILRQLSTLGGNRGPGVAYEQNPTVPLPAAPPSGAFSAPIPGPILPPSLLEGLFGGSLPSGPNAYPAAPEAGGFSQVPRPGNMEGSAVALGAFQAPGASFGVGKAGMLLPAPQSKHGLQGSPEASQGGSSDSDGADAKLVHARKKNREVRSLCGMMASPSSARHPGLLDWEAVLETTVIQESCIVKN